MDNKVYCPNTRYMHKSEWYGNGHLARVTQRSSTLEETFADNKKHGKITYINEDGKKFELKYKNDKLIT